MIQRRIGIDTSVLVRLTTRDPASDYERCLERLEALVSDGLEVVASNQVIGEAYVTLQHHYGATKAAARQALARTLTSGLVTPLNGRAVLDALSASSGAGLMDRLITDNYARAGLETLTLDRRMATLPTAALI